MCKYLSFNLIEYYIKLESRMKLNKNIYQKITFIFYFILIDFYI